MPDTSAVTSSRRSLTARGTSRRGGEPIRRWPGGLARRRAELETRWRDTLERVTALSLAYYDAAERPPPGRMTAGQAEARGSGRVGQLARQAVTERQKLAEIEAALRRIAAGRYGSCEQCGRPISRDLLARRPEARFCPPCVRQAARVHAWAGIPGRPAPASAASVASEGTG